ncbi:hypothetical protein QBC46DRAFT_447340 [Diplogelasinospora grovesii]|uniref:Uncharacterized protein n=1 Tax=Diplogelasinospora grovesii TaxID=303347 RepID=A0AAN6NF50_9PEZI|nr:hypothetical protein QBC46DRAFT_447340 [Diplogelasinospora grovesii]
MYQTSSQPKLKPDRQPHHPPLQVENLLGSNFQQKLQPQPRHQLQEEDSFQGLVVRLQPEPKPQEKSLSESTLKGKLQPQAQVFRPQSQSYPQFQQPPQGQHRPGSVQREPQPQPQPQHQVLPLAQHMSATGFTRDRLSRSHFHIRTHLNRERAGMLDIVQIARANLSTLPRETFGEISWRLACAENVLRNEIIAHDNGLQLESARLGDGMAPLKPLLNVWTGKPLFMFPDLPPFLGGRDIDDQTASTILQGLGLESALSEALVYKRMIIYVKWIRAPMHPGFQVGFGWIGGGK